MVDVLVGINEESFDAVKQRIALLSSYVDWFHIDIQDNTLVPMTTFHDIPLLKDIIEASGKSFEAHLMVANPEKYIKPLVDAGFGRIIAHVECVDPRLFLEEAKFESVEVGLAIDGPTELDQLEPFLDDLDSILVMTIEAGASGQAFLPETVEKVRLLHEQFPDVAIAVDGGINDKTAAVVREAGATRLISTTYLPNDPIRTRDNIDTLRG